MKKVIKVDTSKENIFDFIDNGDQKFHAVALQNFTVQQKNPETIVAGTSYRINFVGYDDMSGKGYFFVNHKDFYCAVVVNEDVIKQVFCK